MLTVKEELIKSLYRQKKYEEIYLQFGGKVYRKCAPLAYQLSDIKTLLQEGRYYAIYEKYGETIYNFLLPYMKSQDIKNELGYDPIDKKVARLEKKLKEIALTVVLTALILNTTCDGLLIAGLNLVNTDDYKEDKEYIEAIDEYDASVEQYANYINNLGLSDLETIVKVMIDIWDNIYGYNDNVAGYSNKVDSGRLAIYTYGYGVCRHLADDFTARMNAINPEYNAFNMTVYMQNSFELNDIERFWFPVDSSNSEDESFSPAVMEFLKSKVGNHMVTCLTIPGTNTKLVVDVTNPSIGVLKNGLITMLTEKSVDDLVPMFVSNVGYKWKDKDTLSEYLFSCLQSYFIPQDIAELREEYGTLAQNEAIKRVSQYDTSVYEINPFNTDNEDPTKGKSPLYYDGYSITCQDGTIIISSLSNDVQSISEVGYREINNFLKRHSDINNVSVYYKNDTIDFSKIDFSLLEHIDNFHILCTFTEPLDKILELKGSITNLKVCFNPQTSLEKRAGQIALRTENAQEITISLENEAESAFLEISPNGNAHSITINSKNKTEYEINNHSGQVKLIYYVGDKLIAEERSNEKKLQKLLP